MAIVGFWLLISVVFYTYLGYGILLFLLLRFNWRSPINRNNNGREWPDVAYVIAAYNEAPWIEEKLQNSLELDYPNEKITIIVVTDGSNDQTPAIVEAISQKSTVKAIRHFHAPPRNGKIHATQRIMPFINAQFTIFSDANTMVNTGAIKAMVSYFRDQKIGAVAGEKRISMDHSDHASKAGEGIYWKYESQLKKWDAAFYSVVGAAGELFAIRTSLFENIPMDTIIEDFYLTMRIAQRGYRVAYAPDAYAVESASVSVAEEMKRKIRIAAGGLQAIYRLQPLLNPIKYGRLSFQYISHRVLRWTIAPLAIPIIFLLNIIILFQRPSLLYQITMACQCLFYLAAIIGLLLERRSLRLKALFIPYYFCMMNYAVYRGFIRLWNGKQSVLWERAKRA